MRILQKSAEEKAKEQEDGLVKPGFVAPVNALLQQRLTCPEWSHGQRIVLCLPAFAAFGPGSANVGVCRSPSRARAKEKVNLARAASQCPEKWVRLCCCLHSLLVLPRSKDKGKSKGKGRGPRQYGEACTCIVQSDSSTSCF